MARVYARTITTLCPAQLRCSEQLIALVDTCRDQRALKLGRCIEWRVSTHARSHNLMASATAVAALPPHRMTCMTLAMLPVPHRTQPYQVNARMTLVIPRAHALRPLRTALLLPHPTM